MTKSITRCRFLALLAVALCLVVSGCSGKGKPTKANYEKIKNDMTEKEVEALMGPATDTIDPKALGKGLGDAAGGMKDKLPGMKDNPFGDIGKGFEALGGMLPKQKYWKDGDTVYFVSFNKDDKVIAKNIGKASDLKPPESPAGQRGGDGKLTKANADKIKNGMKKSEVEEILGPGKASADAGKAGVFVWTEGTKSITVTFVDDKVTAVVKTGF
jgi:hypothetical protein